MPSRDRAWGISGGSGGAYVVHPVLLFFKKNFQERSTAYALRMMVYVGINIYVLLSKWRKMPSQAIKVFKNYPAFTVHASCVIFCWKKRSAALLEHKQILACVCRACRIKVRPWKARKSYVAIWIAMHLHPALFVFRKKLSGALKEHTHKFWWC